MFFSLLSPALLAISVSALAILPAEPDTTPAPVPATNTDPRATLAEEYRRLEALRAQVQAAEQEAAQAREQAAAAKVAALANAQSTPASAPVAALTDPRATMLVAVRLQPASGLDSAARGLTPESQWRLTFPKRNTR
jgi:septal ring factor EnvC (AmiA/AmiB activator)